MRFCAERRPLAAAGVGMMAGLAAEHGERQTVMIDAADLKAHRTATGMGVKEGGVDA